MRKADVVVGDADLLVVHSLFRAHTRWAARNALRRKSNYWAVPHGCLDPWGMANRRLQKRTWLSLYGRTFLTGADRIIFSTTREQQKASRWVSTKRAVVVNWPVPMPSEISTDRQHQKFREELGVSATARILLYVGRLHTMKRILHMVTAFCKADVDDCHLAIVGMADNISPETVPAGVTPNCNNRVHVLGPRHGEQLAAAYRGSDGFISLSHRENFGYAVADAAAYGLPLLLSPGHDLAHDMPYTNGHFACGWLLPNDSIEAATEAIRLFGTTPVDQLQRYGATGTTWVRNELSFARFQNCLRGLVG